MRLREMEKPKYLLCQVDLSDEDMNEVRKCTTASFSVLQSNGKYRNKEVLLCKENDRYRYTYLVLKED